MAIDSWLLEQGRPAFRLYRWLRPTLSLGFHQRQLLPHWPALVGQGVIDLVRRPTGGRAVLHGGELTYALIWPNSGLSRQEAYRRSCAWLQLAFARMGLPLGFGDQAASLERSSCFASSTAADLVHAGGQKRIGSAQLWRQGCLLQQGSILIKPPVELWQQVFSAPPPVLPDLPIELDALEPCLLEAAREQLPMALTEPEPLRRWEWDQISCRRVDSAAQMPTL
jgi:lipoate-protein ligase A